MFDVLIYDQFMVEVVLEPQGNRSRAANTVRDRLILQHGESNVPSYATLYKRYSAFVNRSRLPSNSRRRPTVLPDRRSSGRLASPVEATQSGTLSDDLTTASEPPPARPPYAPRVDLRTLNLSQFYPSLSQERPLVLMLLNTDFDGTEEEKKEYYRTGSLWKCYMWKVYLEHNGYEVRERMNLTGAQMNSELSAFYGNNEHETRSRAMVLFSSHGENNVIYGTDWAPVYISSVESDFSAAPSLRNKLKILLLSSCSEWSGKLPPKSQQCSEKDGRLHYHLITVFSTVPGHASMRSSRNGGVTMNQLLQELRINGNRYDFEQIVKNVLSFLETKTAPIVDPVTKEVTHVVTCPKKADTITKKFYLPMIINK